MSEGTKTMPVLDWELDEGLVECALAAAATAPPEVRIRAAVEAVVEFAEADPEAAREALWELRGDHPTLALLEAAIGGGAKQATLALGAAIQLADAELSSPAPDLRSRLPELMRWLEADW